MAMGVITIEAANILNAPTSPGENTSSPRFIKINELPQMSVSRINKNQANGSVRSVS
jgi:hypothetical protein